MSEVVKTQPVLLNTELTVTVGKRNAKFRMNSYQNTPDEGGV